MICTTCGTQNIGGAKFCMECASPLVSGCPNCGFVNLPGAKFCSECATPLSGRAAATPGATAPVARDETVAERRLVSVLFADLVGFTPFAEERDSEDVRETLTKYFELAGDVVARYGGTIEKFIGDAVMAVWGTPTTHEDDAERAVRAALELVEAVPSLGAGIAARAGVLTGEAAVTLGATNQGMVAGDIVNTASRLQSAAPPGTVLVGEATYRSASKAIAFEPAGEQTLKGKLAPVAAWRATRVVAERGGRNRTEAVEAPFVGRAEEMRLLKDLFHTTGRERRLRVVSVIGPGGIGKSRLAREFLKYIDGLVETVYWHSGRSPAYGEGITFWALGEMVRERCGLREDDDEQTTRQKVGETVAAVVTDPDEQTWIADALLTLLGLGSGMAAEQLFGAWRTFFERLAEQGTVVLVFEDMHFADTGLLEFVDHLLDWSRGLPIYVVTLARPDLIERRPDWGAGKRNFVSMYLEPLPDEQMRELLAGLVPGLPETAVATIVARADGIPLYAVETVRTLVSEGRLVERDGVYVPEGDLATLTIPETLTALIAARLDGLEETDRRIVHDAAVLGQSFSIAALAAVAGMAEADLDPRLAGLVRRELFERQMDARSPERGQYGFVQALIREVAYNTLARKDRKKLHLAAARYFESLGSDELAGALASHYLAAYSNAAEGDEADALGAQARIALKAAASRASMLGSFDQAVNFLDQALSVTTDPAERVELLRGAADNARITGQVPRAEKDLREALELARGIGDRDQLASITSQLAAMLIFQYRVEDANRLLEPAVQEFAGANEVVLAELNLQVARAAFVNNDFARALAILEGVLEMVERRGLGKLVAEGLLLRGNALWSMGRRREAYGAAYVARDLAVEHGLVETQLRVRGNLANAKSETDVREAVDDWLEVLALARKLGRRGALLGGIGNYGYSAFVAGDWDAGLAAMDEVLGEDMPDRERLIMLNNALIIRASRGEDIKDGLAEMERLGAPMSGRWRIYLADPRANAAMARGDLADARDSFLELAQGDESQAEYSYRAGRVALWEGDAAEAHVLLDRYRAGGSYGRLAEARDKTVSAGIAALEGRPKEASALYREALTAWRAGHATWDEALTGVDMALLLDRADPEVAAVVASTREILERLGARPYLELLDREVASPASRPQPVGDTALAEAAAADSRAVTNAG